MGWAGPVAGRLWFHRFHTHRKGFLSGAQGPLHVSAPPPNLETPALATMKPCPHPQLWRAAGGVGDLCISVPLGQPQGPWELSGSIASRSSGLARQHWVSFELWSLRGLEKAAPLWILTKHPGGVSQDFKVQAKKKNRLKWDSAHDPEINSRMLYQLG